MSPNAEDESTCLFYSRSWERSIRVCLRVPSLLSNYSALPREFDLTVPTSPRYIRVDEGSTRHAGRVYSILVGQGTPVGADPVLACHINDNVDSREYQGRTSQAERLCGKKVREPWYQGIAKVT